MDESFISLDQTQLQPVVETAPKRRFWTRMRRKSEDGADSNEHDSSHTGDSSKSWKMKKSNGREKKKTRLSIWKSWFLTLVKPGSKSNIRLGVHEPDMVDLNSVPSIVMNQPPFSIVTDSIMDTWRKAKESNLVMAITLPEGVAGKDIKLNVELKAFPKTANSHDLLDLNRGLRLVEQSSSGPVYFGTVKVPSLTNILQVSRMPLYLINPKTSKAEPKIETIIRPAENSLPENYDKTLIIEDIAIRIDFETKAVFELPQLEYTFLLDVIPIVSRDKLLLAPEHSSMISLDLDPILSMSSLNTTDFIDQITNEPLVTQAYNETSKNLVKEILNQVVSKVSLTSTDFIEDFHKELELQKSLLLETTSSILPNPDSLLSKISETDQEDVLSTSKNIFKTSTKQDHQDRTSVTSTWDSIAKPESNTYVTYQFSVPSNTPDQGTLPYFQKMTTSARQEVRADIDRTLELLEMAKNRLLKYLNRGNGGMVQDECRRVKPPLQEDVLEVVGKVETVTVKVEPFKHFEDLQCSPEAANAEDEKPPDIKPAGIPVDPIEEPIADDEESDSHKDWIDDKKFSTNPVHEMNLLLLEEFHKQTGVDITGREKFDLEDLAKANVFVDETKIEDMILISDDDLYLMIEYSTLSLNDEVFENRFAFDEDLTNFAKDRLEDDISIMIDEIKEQSEVIKEACKKKIKEKKIIGDVMYVLEKLIHKVECQTMLAARQQAVIPLVPQVSPVYFCLIDNYVDVFLSAGRASAWIAHRLRTMTDTERKSTVSVRRIMSNGQKEMTSRSLEISRTDDLLQNLEKGCKYLSELYKEIFSRNLNCLPSNSLYAMNKTKDDSLPLVRKSKKMLSYEKKRSSCQSGHSKEEEQEEKVIEPAEEFPKKCNTDVQHISSDDPYLELSRWPSWKRAWIKVFTRQHASNEVDGFRQLNDLVAIRKTVNPPNICNVHGRTTSDITLTAPAKTHRNTRKLRIKPFEIRKETLVNFMEPSKESEIDDVDKCKKVSFAQPDKDDPNKELSKKKTFKTSCAPAFQNDSAVPGPSSTKDISLVLLHDAEKDSFSSEVDLDHAPLDESVLSTKIRQPVADIPRGFASSSMEQAYMNNINVLQHRTYSASVATIFSSSSSSVGSYQPAAKSGSSVFSFTHSCNSSMLAQQSSHADVSKTNYVPNSRSNSEITTQSLFSPPSSSDYLADTDVPQVVIPDERRTYTSRPEMNPPEEIARIEQNVHQNEYFNPPMKSLSVVVDSSINSFESHSSTTSLSIKSTDVDQH